jgi:hypothetical protein
MARQENPPFGRGETFYNGGTIVSLGISGAGSANYGGPQMEGKEWEFEDVSYNNPGQVGAKPNRTNRMCLCRIVRNVSGINLLPGRLANFTLNASDQLNGGQDFGAEVDGYASTTAQFVGGVIDEWLPAAGVPAFDLFWLVVRGPSSVLTDLAAGINNNIAVGDVLVALTAATSQCTTAGRVGEQAITATSTSPLALQVMNFIGRALSAVTTAQTNASILAEIRQLY